jgi:hypothetical protein
VSHKVNLRREVTVSSVRLLESLSSGSKAAVFGVLTEVFGLEQCFPIAVSVNFSSEN